MQCGVHFEREQKLVVYEELWQMLQDAQENLAYKTVQSVPQTNDAFLKSKALHHIKL